MTVLLPEQPNTTQGNLLLVLIISQTFITQEDLIIALMKDVFILEMPVGYIYDHKIILRKVINSKIFVMKDMQDIWLPHNLLILNWLKVNMQDYSFLKATVLLFKWAKMYNIKGNLKFTTTKMRNTCHKDKYHNNHINENFCHSDQ
mgnify:FL=1